MQQGSKKAAVKILKNFDEAITVDIASLDPESLYQRPYAGWVSVSDSRLFQCRLHLEYSLFVGGLTWIVDRVV